MSERKEQDARFDEMSRFVLGELEPEDQARFERRLEREESLAREVRRLRETLDLLPHAARRTPPPGLRDRVLRDARAAQTPSPKVRSIAPSARAPASPPRRGPWAPAFALAASLAAVWFAYDAYDARRDLAVHREVAAMLAEPNVVVRYEMAGVGEAQGSFGAVSLDLDDRKGAVALRSLPPLPGGQVYTLWAQVADESVPCGTFRANDEGRVLTQFAVPVDSYTAPIEKLFVTIEPEAGAARPTGPTVLESV